MDIFKVFEHNVTDNIGDLPKYIMAFLIYLYIFLYIYIPQLELCLNWIVPFVTNVHVTSKHTSFQEAEPF